MLSSSDDFAASGVAVGHSPSRERRLLLRQVTPPSASFSRTALFLFQITSPHRRTKGLLTSLQVALNQLWNHELPEKQATVNAESLSLSSPLQAYEEQ